MNAADFAATDCWAPRPQSPPTRALGDNYGAVTDGRGGTVAPSHHPAARASPPTRGSRLKRRTPHRATRTGPRSPQTSGRLARTTGDSAPFSEPLRNIPFGDYIPPKEINFEALLIIGSKPSPSRVRQAPQIARVRDCMDVPYSNPRTRSSRHPTQCSRPVEGA